MRKELSLVFDEYIRAKIVLKGRARGTQANYENTKKLAMNFFGDVPIDTINAEDVRDFHEHLLGWQSVDTAAGNIVSFRCLLKFCHKKGLTFIDPDDIDIPKRKKRIIKYLTEPEYYNFLAVISQRHRGYAEINRVRNIAIIELLYATGLRVGELCRLNRNTIKNRQFIVSGKSKDPRLCFTTPEVEKLIKDYLVLRDDDNPALFVANQTGKRITPDNVRRVFRFACDRSDFYQVTPHTIRHSYATNLLEKEVDLRYIGDLLGHQSLDTTRLYTHFSNPKLHRIYDQAMIKSH